MNEREVRIRVALPFQRATPELRSLIREHVERLHVALLEEGHEVDAEVREMRETDNGFEVIHSRWCV